MELLAKSDPRVTLYQHICDGLRILDCLKVCFPKTPVIAGQPAFWEWLRLCVVLHDSGKGHAEFQKVLALEKSNNWKGQRHELFSLSFVQACLPGHEALQLIGRVVAGHHKTMRYLADHISTQYPDAEEFEREFDQVAVAAVEQVLAASGVPVQQEVVALFPRKVVAPYRAECRAEAIADRHLLLLLTGAFKQCDHLSSAFVDKVDILPVERFGFLDKKRAALQAEGKDFFSHQQKAATETRSLIVTAPTGAGKTETALLWLRRQIEVEGQGRVFYVLPFTASINAMWRRLKDEEKGFGERQVGMLHGNLDAVLYEQLFEETGDVRQTTEQLKIIKETFKNLETPLKVVTPFQLLKHIFGLKGFEKGLFEMAGGYFIFDEIHAYDPAVFAQIMVLLEYALQTLDARAMIMTATLPTFLKKEIQRVADFGAVSADDELYRRFLRHRLEVLPGEITGSLARIVAAVKAGQNVLVVCNTVLRAQEVFDFVREEAELKEDDALLLHGAFNGQDRAEKERRLKDRPPCLLVGTQAIEVSLDIDYDVLYSELAPLDALLQRFGRVNRHRFWQDPPRPVYVFAERNDRDRFIYDNPTVMENTLAVLHRIAAQNAGVIEEQELQTYMDEVYAGFTADDREKYDNTYRYLRNALARLAPMEPSEQAEEDFYKQFDGEKVLPAELYEEFCRRLNDFDFIGAQRLKVGIRRGELARWKKGGIIVEKKFIREIPGREPPKLLEIKFLVVCLPYSALLGLQKTAAPLSTAFLEEKFI